MSIENMRRQHRVTMISHEARLRMATMPRAMLPHTLAMSCGNFFHARMPQARRVTGVACRAAILRHKMSRDAVVTSPFSPRRHAVVQPVRGEEDATPAVAPDCYLFAEIYMLIAALPHGLCRPRTFFAYAAAPSSLLRERIAATLLSRHATSAAEDASQHVAAYAPGAASLHTAPVRYGSGSAHARVTLPRIRGVWRTSAPRVYAPRRVAIRCHSVFCRCRRCAPLDMPPPMNQ